jgi:peptide chain release factor 2
MSWCVFDVPSLEAEAAALEAQSAEPDFWNEQQSAQDAMRRLAAVRARVATWRGLETKVADLLELVDRPSRVR